MHTNFKVELKTSIILLIFQKFMTPKLSDIMKENVIHLLHYSIENFSVISRIKMIRHE